MSTRLSNKRKFHEICTVTLYVGKAREKFQVHKNQLCEVSSFFNAAFTSQFRESSEMSKQLPEDDVDTVELFIQWLYTRQYNLLAPQNDSTDHLQSMQLAVFADKYEIAGLTALVFEKLLAYFAVDGHTPPSYRAVDYVYANTCKGSGLRKFIVDFYSFINDEWYRREETQSWFLALPEFAVDLLTELAQDVDSRVQRRRDPAKFRTTYIPARYIGKGASGPAKDESKKPSGGG